MIIIIIYRVYYSTTNAGSVYNVHDEYVVCIIYITTLYIPPTSQSYVIHLKTFQIGNNYSDNVYKINACDSVRIKSILLPESYEDIGLYG